MDRSKPVRPDVTLFNKVDIAITLGGVNAQQADDLVQRFRRR
jgi:hypothetical protein